MAIANLRVSITPLPTPDRSWLDTLSNSLGSAIDTAAQNKAFEQNVIPAITGTPAPQQQPGFLGRLFGGNRIPAPAAQQQVAATNPVPAQGSVAVGTPNDIQTQFIDTARAGGLTNPYGLAALAATGRAESSWDPSKVNAAWPDPSQSGAPGTAGGILSWRNERLANLRNFAQSQGADPSNISPELQAKFFLQEDPTLIQRLNAAKSPQEAAGIMANAWKFAGYDQAGGEAARRAAMTQNYYSQFANAQPPAATPAGPTQVASLDPSIGLPMPGAADEMRATNPAPAASGFDPATATPSQLNAALGPNPQPGYVDPVVTTAYRQTPPAAGSSPVNPPVQSAQAAPAAAAPVASAGPDTIAAAQPATRQNVTNDQIAAMVRNPYTRQVGLQLWQQVLTGKTAQPWSFVKLDDGTLARANQSTGEVQSLGKFASSKKEILSNGKGAFYDAGSGQWITPPEGMAGATEYGLAPIYGTDANGNTVIGQLAKDGTFQQTRLPAGFVPTPGVSNTDLGTSVITRNNKTGQIIDTQAKDVRGEARDKAGGTAQAAAQTALPAVEGAANQILSSIDSLANDPYLPKMLGKSSYLPNVTTDSQRVQSKMDQITGQTFLQAYNTLRGAGQITEVEGQKATAAMGRLNTAQSEKDYRDALGDLRTVVQNAVQRARQQAGQLAAPQPSEPVGNTTSSGVKWSIEQ
ncbi:phage tail tip lysozyme [Rhizobium hainanense]|uniref:Phage tail lysozyme domain-containing protein n=1 Tax=Rhizobium hainanense TaxID=52131 RepID=A0A1C3UM10_9HYPH|nr:phage tail tip lysozyme [Rhizobium hainanense]SCB16523.1 hypothetical protein GA0061100_102622 [Rhizobium hainanense]